ncbi:GNAT family N-acetyltransferase [Glycomyces buryatensis]|uniref:GNAT family N-acetyltransferase n=1 Tax=Glycomyces buryatensis TaxID=2570927 RepID=A0A4V6T6S4_9ACTN|nr:GNAT family N-acetyltransferase [Glycomyces buryatensis]THV43306.1 GNAT family N-acetyltransferase [Glycomyces buryatensis]
MPLKQLVPSEMTADDIRDWCSVLNDMTAADMPAEPRWRTDRLRDYLVGTLPDDRRFAFLYRDDDGDLIGHASLIMFGGDQAGTGVVEMSTRPSARGHGVGKALLRAVAACAKAEGCRTLSVEVIATTPAVGFYDRVGFKRAVVEQRHLLRWADVDWEKIEQAAGRLAAGYRLEYHAGGVPERLLDTYAGVKANLRANADVAVVPEWRGSAQADRLRDSLATLERRGMRSHIVVALAEPFGHVVGLTELVVAAQRPTRADQYDTVVDPAHRSYGLAMSMKARLLTELRRAEPQLTDVQTWTIETADDVRWINSELGFVHDVDWYDYEADVDKLIERIERDA